MTQNVRNGLGAASLLPLLTTVLIRQEALVSAAASGPGAAVMISLVLVLLFAGIGATFFFAWLVAGMEERPFAWKLGWVLALTVLGGATAPVFWYLHVRTAPEASGA